MIETFTLPTATQRVVARLRSEGWVDCLELDFPALIQHPIPDLPAFILSQIKASGGWMWKEDLQLSALIFSIPAHEFQFHPHLRSALKRLEAEGLIEHQKLCKPSLRGEKLETAVFLRPSQVASA